MLELWRAISLRHERYSSRPDRGGAQRPQEVYLREGGQTVSATQAPHHTSDEPVARVLALVDGEGYSIRGAAAIVGVPPHTAIDWVRRARKLAQGNKPILDKWTRRVDQSLDLIQDGLDLIEADESRALALKNLQTLNIIAGTGTDKLRVWRFFRARAL